MALLTYKWLLITLLGWAHPFYVSVTEINHNAKDKTLEVSCKIFVDDMEEVLKKNSAISVDLASEKQKGQNDKLLTAYIFKHLALSVDGKDTKLSYVGFEKDKESVYCYFEVTNIATVKKIDLTNSLLHDLNQQQINIMHVTMNGSRKSYKLDYPKSEAGFVF
jgi:hypothetical protein